MSKSSVKHIAFCLLLLSTFTVEAQFLQLGTRLGFAGTYLETNSLKLEFANEYNETNYIYGLKKSSTIVTPSFLTVSFLGKNRLGIYLDAHLVRYTYEYDMGITPIEPYSQVAQVWNFSDGVYEDHFQLQINTSYAVFEGGGSVELFPRRLIKPFVTFGAQYYQFLTISERIPGVKNNSGQSMSFTNYDTREVRNSVIYRSVNTFNSFVTANVGVGFRVYNIYLLANAGASITDVDELGFYKTKYVYSVKLGVDLISLVLSKKQ